MPQGCTRPLAKVSTFKGRLVFCAGALVISADEGTDCMQRPSSKAGRARMRMSESLLSILGVMGMSHERFKAGFASIFRHSRQPALIVPEAHAPYKGACQTDCHSPR